MTLGLVTRYCGDRLDVWVTRWANHVVSKYHGIGEVEFCNTSLVRPTKLGLC